jgi:periplasmic divalent cation tolerance protein
MERPIFVYVTFPVLAEAERVGQAIIARRLAACVNILPGMISHYWWEGKVERGEEVVALFKTRAALADALAAAVKELHSYTTPAIVTLPVEGGDAAYLGWIMAETMGGEG